MAPFESLGTLSYSHFAATVVLSLAVSEILSIKEWGYLENWVKGCSRSLKIVPFDRLFTTFYWSSIVTFTSYLTFNNILILKCVTTLKVTETGTIRKLGYTVSNLPSVVIMALCCIISEIKRENRKLRFFSYPLHSTSTLGGSALKYCRAVWYAKTRMVWGYPMVKKFEDTFSRFDRISACDGQIDRRTDGQKDILRRHSPRCA